MKPKLEPSAISRQRSADDANLTQSKLKAESTRRHDDVFVATESRKPKATVGFTLIELLTVIAIIAILAGLLFPAIRSALKKAEVTQAKSDVKAIETGIKAYYTEYGKLPVPDADQGIAGDAYYGTGGGGCNGDSGKFQYDIIDTLRAVSTSGHANFNNYLNPRQIVFLDTPSRKGALDGSGYFRDIWGNVYFIKMDTDYSGSVGYYGLTNSTAIIVSYGPDGTTASPCGQCDPSSSSCNDIVSAQ